MFRRVVDQKDLSSLERHFVRRHMRTDDVRYIVIAMSAFVLCFMAYLVLMNAIPFTILALMAVTFVGMFGLLLLYMQKLGNQLFASEFENALFAGAAHAGVEFLLIVKHNLEIVYYSPSCRNYFDHDFNRKSETLYDVLKRWEVDGDTARRILHSVHHHQEAVYQLELEHQQQGETSVDFMIEPIRRPRDYMVVKGVRSQRMGEVTGYRPNSLTLLFDVMPTPLFKSSASGVLYYVNKAFADFLGYPAAMLTDGSTRLQDLLFDAEDVSRYDLSQRTVMKLIVRHKDGHPVTVVMRKLSVPPGDDSMGLMSGGYIYKYGDDAEDYVLPEEHLEHHMPLDEFDQQQNDAFEMLWRQFIETAPVAVAVLDRVGLVTDSNMLFRKMVGKSLEETQELKVFDLCLPEDKNIIGTFLQTADTTLRYEAIEIHLANVRDGVAKLHLQQIRTRQGADGKSIFIAYVIDMTEQKRLEHRMIHSQRMQAVGQLAGGVAHDFNNLLTAMIGFCDLLLMRHTPGEESFADIMQIKQNANRASNLVRQLLAFSRKQTLQPKVVEISDALGELSNLLRRLIGDNIDLSIKHERDLWPVCVDPGQLEQVIINLAVNARDAMEGYGSLTVRTRKLVVENAVDEFKSYTAGANVDDIRGGDYVAIEISDTGKGMSREVLEQIFEPFFTTKGVGEGTGLGLATVLGIIEQTGGHVLVKSAEGQGTSFLILLRRHAVKEGEKVEEQNVLPSDLTGSGKVLLVEDEAPVRMFASRALANKGYEVVTAENGEDGLEVYEEHKGKVDLIITDVMMPGITGPEMVKEIQKDNPELSVIFMSGYGEDEFIKSFGETRNFEFLPKPFTLNDLAAKVKNILEK